MSDQPREALLKRLEGMEQMPTIPIVLAPLLRYLEQPLDQLEVQQVVDLISQDKSLAAQCLHMANSATLRTLADRGQHPKRGSRPGSAAHARHRRFLFRADTAAQRKNHHGSRGVLGALPGLRTGLPPVCPQNRIFRPRQGVSRRFAPRHRNRRSFVDIAPRIRRHPPTGAGTQHIPCTKRSSRLWDASLRNWEDGCGDAGISLPISSRPSVAIMIAPAQPPIAILWLSLHSVTCCAA